MSEPTQGQSRATIDKERRISSALSIGMKIANRKFRGFTFWHFDANAGCGFNEVAQVPGSPMAFHAMADLYLTDMRREAFFCDLNKRALADLEKRLHVSGHLPTSYLLPGDNEDALQVFAERIRQRDKPHYAVGSILVDPNGYWWRTSGGEGAPVNAVSRFVEEFPKIDIILNLNTRTYRLMKPHSWARNLLDPLSVFSSLKKSHWLVGRAQYGGDEFLLAVGRNIETGDHRSLGLHKIESDEGKKILLLAEGKRQGLLFNENTLPQLPGISAPSGLSGGSRGGNASDAGPLFMRSDRDGSSPSEISALGDVRRAVES